MARRVVALLVGAVLVAGCGAGLADGPRTRICGDWIGRALILGGSGPFYVDASGRPPTITAAARSSPIWVRVSPSCQHGATVATSNPAVISVTGAVPARDGTGRMSRSWWRPEPPGTPS